MEGNCSWTNGACITLRQLPRGRSEFSIELPCYAVLERYCPTSVLCIRIISVVKDTARPRGDYYVAAIVVDRPVCSAELGVEMLYQLPKLDTSERNICGVVKIGSVHTHHEGT